ncbi:MAG TPA: TatD family hydrolase [Acidobacteriota bacterium]|nr:TatD family hydrolase [Acidobacteriota bacterium]
MKHMWIDAHTHLDSDDLYIQKDAVLQRAAEAGVHALLQVNSEATVESMQRSVEILNAPSSVKKWGAFGIHPHQASLYNPTLENQLIEFLRKPEVISLGEIGLDFFYNYSPPQVQEEVLRKQLQLSLRLNLPVVIHCRDAYPRLAQILKEEQSNWKGMIHCFTGVKKEVEPLLDLGFHISFSGIVTFRKAETLQSAAMSIPLNRILVETDAPYLAPVPKRGKTNEPAFVVHIGEFLAKLRGISNEDLAARITNNFNELFMAT